MHAADLNRRFGLAGHLSFREDPGGLVFAEIDNAGGSASLCLQGAHVVTWRPRTESEPVIWVSPQAKFAPGKSIRGGVPICWPWFGPHPAESSFPGHGFARTVPWAVTHSEALADGRTLLGLTLVETDQTRAQWPHATRLDLMVTVGASLEIALTTTNLGTGEIEIGEALHTYFQIGDIAAVRIHGLENTTYVDKTDGGVRKAEAGVLSCSGEVDRVYLDTRAECIIEDPDLGRRIRIGKTGSRSTVVWTPWTEKAEKMGDFGPGRAGQGGWREMVCVESGNALDNVVRIAPGASHTLGVSYRAESL
jgi:D-hexose-6-phosphate mutarotase